MRENAAEKKYLIELSQEFGVPLSMLYKPQNVAPADINASVADEEPAKMDDGAKIVEDDVDPDDEETFNK